MDKPLNECIKMEYVCKIDGEKFDTEKKLHMHLRKHKMRMAEYYQKYYPRRDLLTGDLIKFKNKAHYFANYFNSRPNMKKYLESASEEDARKFCVQVIKDRMIERAPNATRLMDKLNDKKLIERIRCEHDRRVVYINISKQGLELLSTIDTSLKLDFLENLTEKEAAQLSDLLDKIR